jgi:hypothetical protein
MTSYLHPPGTRLLAVAALAGVALTSAVGCSSSAAAPAPVARVQATRLPATPAAARAAYNLAVDPVHNTATIRRTATGALVARVPAPAGTRFTVVAGAGRSRAFLLATKPDTRSGRIARFWLLRLSASGRPGPLRRARIPALAIGAHGRCNVSLAGLAVAPGGRIAAVSTMSFCANGEPGQSLIEIVSLDSGHVLHRVRPGRDYPLWLSLTARGSLVYSWGFGVFWIPRAAAPGHVRLTPHSLIPALAGTRGFNSADDPMVTPDGSAVIVTLGSQRGVVVAAYSVRTRRFRPVIIGPVPAPSRYCGPLWTGGTGRSTRHGQHVLAACGDGTEVSVDNGRITRLAAPWRMPFYAVPGPPLIAFG